MRTSTFIFKCCFVLMPFFATAQSSYLILGGKEQTMLDRLEIKTRVPMLSFSAVKPYNRKAAVEEVEYYDSLYNAGDKRAKVLTDIDKYDMQRFLMANDEWSKPREIYKSEKPLFKYFYQNRANAFDMQNKDFVLIANPIIRYEMGGKGGNTQSTYINQRGASIRGIIGGSLGFDFYFTENQERNPTYEQDWVAKYSAVPGVGYYKSFKEQGNDFFDVRGSMTWGVAKFMNMQFGYDKNFIGDGYRSLLLSDFSNNALFLKVQTHFGKFYYENLFMELVAQHSHGGDYIYPRKYYGMSHLSYHATKWLTVGLFDAIIYNQVEGVPIELLNPVIYAHIPNDQDAMIKNKAYTGFDLKLNLAKKIQLYGQGIIDKIDLSQLSNNWWNNKFGYQAGLKYIDMFGLKNFNLQLETNRVRPFTYSSNDAYTSYGHYNQPFAHPLGANFEEYIAIVKAQPVKKLYLEAKLIYYRQGLDSAGYNMGQNIFSHNNTRPRDYGWKIGTGDLATCTIVTLLASYELKENLFFEVTLLSRNYTLASTGSDNINVIGAGFRWNIGRREFIF